ncbi:MAG: hypothetical protein KJ666_07075 [Bacteroidetes bacterium]|nr:hypothetical protein [Bacteroidota bacterium]MBU2584421.1 hypothetical protein [Bacteroidota bacterium]
MTVNRMLRSMAAASRRSERESMRRQREHEKQEKQFTKLQAIEDVAFEVEEFENRVALLKSMHQDCSETWNWQKIRDSEPPEKPIKRNDNETFAIQSMDNYKPSIGDKLFRKVEKKKLALADEVEKAKDTDEVIYKENNKKYESEFNEWNDVKGLASRIINSDIAAYKEAIEQVNPFNEINEIGSSIEFKILSKEIMDVTLNVNSSETIPSEEKTQLKSGKLSVKQMPKSKFYELYQDYVCSCVLRVAREIVSLLPIEKVLVTAVAELLNKKTGYLETQPILSVQIPKITLNKLNFANIDPSDAMSNFKHNMSFKKTVGFDAVEKMTL